MKKYASQATKEYLQTLIDVRVSNLHNRNQFVIKIGSYKVFQSYESIIAVYDETRNDLYVVEEFINYSKTTSKHLYIFMREECNLYTISNLKDLLKSIKKGNIILIK